MKVVTSADQILSNLAELERGLSSASESLRNAHRQLIKRGTCFLSYQSSECIGFAPSRFVGYMNNKLASHIANPNRDGRVTNAALTAILGAPPSPDADLEKRYLAFCDRIGVSPSKTGTFGVARKYWASSDVLELLDQEEVAAITASPDLTATEKKQLIKARVGQGLFRNQLLTFWKSCCVTSCGMQMLLRASHIKPWCKSTNRERLDKFNGLLLSPNADMLFDKGFISFTDAGNMLVSPQVKVDQLVLLLGRSTVKIRTKHDHTRYLAYHRKHRFRAAAA